jgi:CheY-like chemotaxis protein
VGGVEARRGSDVPVHGPEASITGIGGVAVLGRLPVLFVEDDPVDVMSLQRAFARCGISNPLYSAANGEEALALLRATPGSRPRPGLILLDLNMPVMSGLEFLEVQKKDDDLRLIPVVVITSSSQESDRRRSYELGAAGFVTKPMQFESFVSMVDAIHRYWSLCEEP